jgi:hypothetical protein
MSALDIIVTCEEAWPKNKNDCSAFVRDVARYLDVALAGNADTIVETIRKKWRRLDDGVAAKKAADDGEFVVAGLKGSEQIPPVQHGHVVVVVAGDLAHNKYPTAYWGRLGGVGERNKTVNYAWRAVDRDKVTYAAARDYTPP